MVILFGGGLYNKRYKTTNRKQTKIVFANVIVSPLGTA